MSFVITVEILILFQDVSEGVVVSLNVSQNRNKKIFSQKFI